MWWSGQHMARQQNCIMHTVHALAAGELGRVRASMSAPQGTRTALAGPRWQLGAVGVCSQCTLLSYPWAAACHPRAAFAEREGVSAASQVRWLCVPSFARQLQARSVLRVEGPKGCCVGIWVGHVAASATPWRRGAVAIWLLTRHFTGAPTRVQGLVILYKP